MKKRRKSKKPKEAKPPRSEQHEIDEAAQNVFRSILPVMSEPGNSAQCTWVKGEQKPDIYVDYLVEPFHGGEPSGLQIGIQLKGAKLPKYRSGFISFPFEAKHLAYYVDKRHEPFFLVVADVTAGEAYYVFLQELALEQPAPGWRKKTKVKDATVTIRPPQQQFTQSR